MEALHRHGVVDVILSPGSRNTPLAYAADAHPDLNLHKILDERSAGFAAIGLSKATDLHPVALICSSGTAAAEYLPAAAEALLSRIPLILLTADRPPEEHDIASPQTLAQAGIFGQHVKDSFSPGPPEPDQLWLQRLIGHTSRLTTAATTEPLGPVHLNLAFREPLAPTTVPGDASIASHYPTGVRGVLVPTAEMIQQTKMLLGERPLIVAGQGAPELAWDLAETLRIPLAGDILFNGNRSTPAITHIDQLVQSEQLDGLLRPTGIVRFGTIPTSKALNRWLSSNAAVPQILVDSGGWRDPNASSHLVLDVDSRQFILALLESASPAADSWLEAWVGADSQVSGALDDLPFPSEPAIAEMIARKAGDRAVYVGSGMAVRDLDAFAGNAEVKVHANRGANGIDGVIASAAGAAISGNDILLLIGDVGFLHDHGSLLTATNLGVRLTIIVVNNGGGGIFHFLPQATTPGPFELLSTPHEVDLGALARGAGFIHEIVQTGDALERSLLATSEPRRVIEIITDRTDNRQLHMSLNAAVKQALTN